MISSVSGRCLAKRLLNCFHTAHTHPSGGVDVPLFLGRVDPQEPCMRKIWKTLPDS